MTILKPVFLIGNGVRNNPELIEKLCQLNVPVLTTWQAADLIPEDSPVFCGRPGTVGQRAANIIIQKCNWLMVVGARLDMETVGHNLAGFAPRAEKTVVDVDPKELEKFPKEWNRYLMDLNHPFDNSYGDRVLPFVSGDLEWLKNCRMIYDQLRRELDGGDFGENSIDPYLFINALSDACQEGDIIVPGSSGMQSCAFFQAFKVKRGQRILCCNTIGAMGFEPMAIGAAVASGRRVIVVTGDGGFAQNMQELEIVRRLGLKIHYFIFDNAGYGSISAMQDTRFGLRVGSTEESGFTVPDIQGMAELFGFDYWNMTDAEQLWGIERAINSGKPSMTRVKTSLDFRYACKVSSTMADGKLIPDSFEDLTPHLPADKLAELMA